MNPPLTSPDASAVPPSPSARRTAWAVALAATILLAVLTAATPHLAEGARAAVMQGFSIACHQQPDRSFAAAGVAWALCHRCSGILAGLLLGLLGVRALRTPAEARRFRRLRKPLLVGVIALVAFDWGLGALGLWDTVATRVATGAAFGIAAGLVLGEALVWGHLQADAREQEVGDRG